MSDIKEITGFEQDRIVHMDGKEYAVKTAVIIRGMKIPNSCKECEFIGYPAGCRRDTEYLMERDKPDLELPLEVSSLPHNPRLPFCTIDLENISDSSIRAAHCRLKEVYALERARMTEVYYKLTAPEFENMIAKRDTLGGSYIHLYDKWVDFDMLEFFGDDALFKDEYELISEEEANKLIDEYNKEIERLISGKAEEIAKKYHAGQTDKGDHPYMNHVYSVVNGVDLAEEKIIAYLHDTLEDTSMTMGKMRQHRIPAFIIAHVNLLTHEKDEDYFEYVKRLRHYPFAKSVKMSDLRNNMDTSRLKEVTEEAKERVKKYKKALKLLSE